MPLPLMSIHADACSQYMLYEWFTARLLDMRRQVALTESQRRCACAALRVWHPLLGMRHACMHACMEERAHMIHVACMEAAINRGTTPLHLCVVLGGSPSAL